MLGYRDSLAVTGLAPAWCKWGVDKAPVKYSRPHTKEQ